jgi:radical SAM protein with 4Fe4S-binding SPASM domain
MIAPKVLLRLFRIFADYRKRTDTVNALPIRLWVETSSRCNLRCPMCPNKDMPGKDKTVMEPALFKKIVDEAKSFINDMYIHHRGEPLLNPALFELIAYAREAGIHVRFHSNGALLTPDKAESLLNACPDLVSFSIDGFTAEPYERIRVGAKFDDTVANIIRLAEMRRTRGLKKPYLVVEKIRFHNPDPSENPAAVAELKTRFLAAGVDEVIEKEEYTWAEPGAPEPEGQRTSPCCTFPWYAMVICADGTVTPCPQDFWATMHMGNVRTSSLREIWNGDAYRKLRHQLAHDIDSLPLCRKCDRLRRKTVGGVPFQYMMTFLMDQLVGYNRRLRTLLGTSERNN